MKPWAKIILGMIVLVGILFGLHFATQDVLVHYFPDKTLPTPVQAGVPDMKPVTIQTSDRLNLQSWFQPPQDDTKPVLLFFQGDSGRLSDRVGEFTPYIQHGYGLLLLGYRGFGGNPGQPSEKGLYKDARAAIGWLGKSGYGISRVVLYGHSLGTGIAVQMALEYKARAVVLEAPYTTLPNTVTMNLPILKADWFMKDRFDNMQKIAKVKIPLLIVQGTQDEVIPTAQGRALYAAAKGPKEGDFIPNGGHTNLYDYGEAGLVMNFVDNPPEKEPPAVELHEGK